jgi:hypothetical protein
MKNQILNTKLELKVFFYKNGELSVTIFIQGISV